MSKIYHKNPSNSKAKALGANRDLLRQVFAEALLEQLQTAATGNIPLSLLNISKGVLSRGINDLMRSNVISVNVINGNCIITINPTKTAKITKTNKFGGKK